MVEIYNEQVRDLLAEDSSATKYPFMFAILHKQKFKRKNMLITDLLTMCFSIKPFVFLTASKLEIRSCTNDNSLSLPDATMHNVTSTGDVLNLMKLGELNRAVSSTAVNNRSSRSHRLNYKKLSFCLLFIFLFFWSSSDTK